MGRLAVPMVFRPSEPSPLDGILYAEAGWPAYLLEIQTRVIRKIAANQFCGSASSRSEGSHSRQGGVTHAGESFTPLTSGTRLHFCIPVSWEFPH